MGCLHRWLRAGRVGDRRHPRRSRLARPARRARAVPSARGAELSRARHGQSSRPRRAHVRCAFGAAPGECGWREQPGIRCGRDAAAGLRLRRVAALERRVALRRRDASAALRCGWRRHERDPAVSRAGDAQQCHRAADGGGARVDPPRIERESDLRALDRVPLSYDRIRLYSDHTSGGLSCGADEHRGATDRDGRVFGTAKCTWPTRACFRRAAA